MDLLTIVRSFCDSTTAELNIKIGIASGSISAGIVGCRKWHYDIVGPAYDMAVKLEENGTFKWGFSLTMLFLVKFSCLKIQDA